MINKKTIGESTLTCPKCQHQKSIEMPTTSCQYFYSCDHCQELLKPLAGDCCVFCSYGSIPCPSIQHKNSCCT